MGFSYLFVAEKDWRFSDLDLYFFLQRCQFRAITFFFLTCKAAVIGCIYVRSEQFACLQHGSAMDRCLNAVKCLQDKATAGKQGLCGADRVKKRVMKQNSRILLRIKTKNYKCRSRSGTSSSRLVLYNCDFWISGSNYYYYFFFFTL
ncbi:unnamed protein product [Thlaspi arvense]|uniref:Uncharacterized protein n=1 Tax=Thlaspi arvense TaxID=13288 RepID=A0AAU9S0S0_THLAR|nr:unnamed protein product [Thlaspi arvense]